MKYTNPDFKNLEKNYQDFLGSSEKFIKGLKERELINELKERELINETINKPNQTK